MSYPPYIRALHPYTSNPTASTLARQTRRTATRTRRTKSLWFLGNQNSALWGTRLSGVTVESQQKLRRPSSATLRSALPSPRRNLWTFPIREKGEVQVLTAASVLQKGIKSATGSPARLARMGRAGWKLIITTMRNQPRRLVSDQQKVTAQTGKISWHLVHVCLFFFSITSAGMQLFALYNHTEELNHSPRFYSLRVPLQVWKEAGLITEVHTHWLDYMTQHFTSGAQLVDGFFHLGDYNGMSHTWF